MYATMSHVSIWTYWVDNLVGGFNPSEKYESQWPYIMEKKGLKPPISNGQFGHFGMAFPNPSWDPQQGTSDLRVQPHAAGTGHLKHNVRYIYIYT